MPDLIKHETLISFLFARVRATGVWESARGLYKYARRALLFTRILRYLRITLAIIEASAVLLLFAAVLAVLIPVFLLFGSILAAADFIVGKRILKSEALALELSKKRIYVIGQAGVFGEGLARSLADADSAVFVITAAPKKRFLAAKASDGVYYIRHSFFFRLKRQKLSKLSDKTVYLL